MILKGNYCNFPQIDALIIIIDKTTTGFLYCSKSAQKVGVILGGKMKVFKQKDWSKNILFFDEFLCRGVFGGVDFDKIFSIGAI